MTPIAEILNRLHTRSTTSRALVDACLERAGDPAGEGARVFTRVDAESARSQADVADGLLCEGNAHLPLLGLPVSVKDLFDVRGQVTTAGSVVLADAPPAVEDATV